MLKFACALLPELVFEKTRVYYVNFQFYYLSVILSIKCHLKSFLLSCFHVPVMFLIIPDIFWNFQKSSFSGPPASHFSQRSHLLRQVSQSDWSGFIFKSSHKFALLGGKKFSRKGDHFIFQIYQKVDSFTNSRNWVVHPSSP